jgi:pimeloyl-ACP methyl ester carboxylesterase
MRVEWKGQPIQIRELGQGPTVVLLHGYPLDGAMWSGVARTLSSRFRVLKPDLPGRGENPAPPDGTIDGYADFLQAILAEIPPPAGLAGFSMGGYVSLALMKRGPAAVRALALVDTRAGADDEAGRAARETSIATVRSGGAAAIADGMIGKLLAPASAQNPSLVERLRRIIVRQKPETIASDLMAMRDRPDSTASLARIGVPAIVLAGDQDVISPPAEGQAMADAIPGARFVAIPASGHLTPMERPGAVAAALGDFFAAALV